MGTISSKDTRRISFHNNFAMNPVLVQNAIDDCEEELHINTKSPSSELDFRVTTKPIGLQDDEQDYWDRRIDHLKNEHQIINQIIEKEYEKTLEKTNKLFEPQKVTPGKTQKLKPCLDWQSKILQCYEDNPSKPLVCSALVQAFRNCVATCQLED